MSVLGEDVLVALGMMWKGMLGVSLVMALVALLILLLGKIGHKKGRK